MILVLEKILNKGLVFFWHLKADMLHIIPLTVDTHSNLLSCILSSAVKRFKYLITINGINVIVNSRLIAINHTFFTILNIH